MFPQPQTIDQFQLTHQLCNGQTSFLWQATYNNTFFTIKQFKSGRPSTAQNEFNFGSKLYHPHIAEYYQYRKEAVHTSKRHKTVSEVIIMEYVPNGSMFHLMKNTNGMEEKLLRTYFGMIVEAVEFMHRNNVVHNRIQVENILLDQEYSLKITNFGQATKIPKRTIYPQLQISPGIFIPSNPNQGHCLRPQMSDILQLSQTLLCLATHTFPLYPQSFRLYRLFFRNPQSFFTALPKISEQLQSLIRGMMTVCTEDRMTIEKIKQHPWYNGERYGRAELRRVVVGMLVQWDMR